MEKELASIDQKIYKNPVYYVYIEYSHEYEFDRWEKTLVTGSREARLQRLREVLQDAMIIKKRHNNFTYLQITFWQEGQQKGKIDLLKEKP